MLRTIIFVPHLPDSTRWLRDCAEYCLARGYCIVAVVARLEDIKKAALLHRASRVVSARRAHLLPELPLEVVSEQGHPAEGPKRHRRPERRSWGPPQ